MSLERVVTGFAHVTQPFDVVDQDRLAAVNAVTDCHRITETRSLPAPESVSDVSPRNLEAAVVAVNTNNADSARQPTTDTDSCCGCVLTARHVPFERVDEKWSQVSLGIPSDQRGCFEYNVAITEPARVPQDVDVQNLAQDLEACAARFQRFIENSGPDLAHQLRVADGAEEMRWFAVLGKWKTVRCHGPAANISINRFIDLLSQARQGTLTLHLIVEYEQHPGYSHAVAVFRPYELSRGDWCIPLLDATGGCKRHGPLRFVRLSSLMPADSECDDLRESKLDLARRGIYIYTVRTPPPG